MNRRSTVLTMVAGAIASVSKTFLPTVPNFNERKVKYNNYKTGGKPFTRGKRSKSLKTRANRRKAKR